MFRVLAATAAILALGVLPTGVSVPVVRADVLKCQSTISSAYAKYLKSRAKIVQKCQDAAVRKATPLSPTSCPITANDAKLQALEQKLRDRVAAACGGADRTCNAVGDESLAAIGWGLGTCPDINLDGCTNVITTCDDISTCITCIADEAIANAGGIAYDQLNAVEFNSGSEFNNCQRALGKETVKYFQTRAKLLGKCWSKVVKGSAGFSDPPGCPATDVKLTDKLNRAELKKIAKICGACGAAGDDDKDGLCDAPGSGFTALEIGFEPDCPDLVVPGTGRICDQPGVSTLAEMIDCVDCVAEFVADCGDQAVVPAFTTYPPECNGGP